MQSPDKEEVRRQFMQEVGNQPFAGPLTFFRQPAGDGSQADVALLGVPFDMGTSNRPGARFGPRAVREQSVHACMSEAFPWDWFKSRRLCDCGDTWYFSGDMDQALGRIEEDVLAIRSRGARVLAVGGDHTVTLPLLAGLDQVALIQLDSHDDLGDPFHKPYHGSFLTRALQAGRVDPACSVLVGRRTPPSGDAGILVLDADWLDEHGPVQAARRIRERVGSRPAYLTFDIDFLDPAYAPGTGTPVPGGPTTAQARRLLQNLRGLDLIGADLVEVSPPFDGPGQITALAGAFILAWILDLLTGPTARSAA